MTQGWPDSVPTFRSKASVVGIASFNASAEVTLNVSIGTPGARIIQVDAIVSPANGDGTWADSAANAIATMSASA